jgi:hypothetical protein
MRPKRSLLRLLLVAHARPARFGHPRRRASRKVFRATIRFMPDAEYARKKPVALYRALWADRSAVCYVPRVGERTDKRSSVDPACSSRFWHGIQAARSRLSERIPLRCEDCGAAAS